MDKKPFSTPVITEFGRFEQIVLGPDNPHCPDGELGQKDPPPSYDGGLLGCDPGGDPNARKKDPFCDAWHPCGSSS